ncbi:MAG TPA: tRNA (adenosine(37)-N6)-threonylcarbamoyltransferase complex ATPase subunit type 1 TsaE [Flavobacteriaceae bacterium]|nr:tRNA (adenosine(37)-N6)-threonylcarbamoyltransferase complex ATPase subunit type 1 TsaE [Flavobacteriaceae bacterium]
MEITYSLSELPEVAKKIRQHINSKTLLFFGEMGVGKTTLIKELAKQLGFNDVVSSPTFSLVNEYESENDKLYHFDFYRINDISEAMDMGFEEYVDAGCWSFIEWPEIIQQLIPENSVYIYLTKIDDNIRSLRIE